MCIASNWGLEVSQKLQMLSCHCAACSGPDPMLRAPLEVYCQIVNSEGWSTVSTHPPALLVPYYNLIT